MFISSGHKPDDLLGLHKVFTKAVSGTNRRYDSDSESLDSEESSEESAEFFHNDGECSVGLAFQVTAGVC